MHRGEEDEPWRENEGNKRERGIVSEEKRGKGGTGESEAGNEAVLGRSWREKILTTQQFHSLCL